MDQQGQIQIYIPVYDNATEHWLQASVDRLRYDDCVPIFTKVNLLSLIIKDYSAAWM